MAAEICGLFIMTKYENYLASLAKNANEPCSKCKEKPRHVTKNGKVLTTLCTECNREWQKENRRKMKLHNRVNEEKSMKAIMEDKIHDLILQGLPSDEIANVCQVTPRKAEGIMRRVFKKHNVSSKLELIALELKRIRETNNQVT